MPRSRRVGLRNSRTPAEPSTEIRGYHRPSACLRSSLVASLLCTACRISGLVLRAAWTASLRSTANAGDAHISTAPGTINVQCFLFMSSPFWSEAKTLPVHQGGPLPCSAVMGWLNRVMVERCGTHLHQHLHGSSGTPVRCHVPSRDGTGRRACQIRNLLTTAISAMEGVEQSVDRTATHPVAERLDNDLLDRATLLDVAVQAGCLQLLGRNHRHALRRRA